MTSAAELFPYLSTTIGALGVWHASRTNSKAQTAVAAANAETERMKAEQSTRDAERDDKRDDVRLEDDRWRAMLELQSAHYDRLLAPMTERLGHLETKVGQLEAALASVNARYRLAVDHIRAVHIWDAANRPGPLPTLPAALIDEV